MIKLNLLSQSTRAPQAIDDDKNEDVEDYQTSQPELVAGTPAPRTIFGSHDCDIYGDPSSGAMFVKEADVLDLLSLPLSRSKACERSTDCNEEDKFCTGLQRVGAK